MSKDLLLEIGTEEIPAHYMPSALKQLHEGAADIFAKNHLDYKDIRTVGTPRRLAYWLPDWLKNKPTYRPRTKVRP